MIPLQTPSPLYTANVELGTVSEQVTAIAAVIAVIVSIFSIWLNFRQAARLKVVEADLDKSKFEHQTQFAKLHEKHAEVIQEIYRRIVTLELWVSHVFAETKLPDEQFTSLEGFAEIFDDVFGRISLSLQDLAAYFNLNRLFLDGDICKKILRFHNLILDETEPIHGFFYQRFNRMSEDELQSIYGDNLEERAKETLELVSDSRRAVESAMRQLLGIPQGVQNDDEQIDYDLMWIPQPGIIDPLRWGVRNKGEDAEEEFKRDDKDKTA